MAWWEYVTRITAGEEQAKIAERVRVGQSMISRWQSSTPRPENAAAFAKAYNRPVLEAFIAAGFLTAEEADQQPSEPPTLAIVDDDALLAEIRIRMRRGESDAVPRGRP